MERGDGRGETLVERIIEAVRGLPAGAESTSLVVFVLVLQLTTVNRLSHFDRRFSSSPSPFVCLLVSLEMERPVSSARSGPTNSLLLGVCEGQGLCLSANRAGSEAPL